MACCIVGALILSNLFAFFRAVRRVNVRFLTLFTLGIGLVSFGVTEMAIAALQHGVSGVEILAWCAGGSARN